MEPALLVLLSLVILALCVFYVKIPVGLLLAILGFAGYALLDGFASARTMLGNELWGTFSGPGLTVIPLFIFMGQVAFYSGLCQRLYNSIAAWAGQKPGGIAWASLLACAGFSAICGSNSAAAATMSVAALPEMKKYGYEPFFAAAVISVGTTLGAVIPPSVVAIVLSTQTGIPAQKLFVGGIAPGILLLLLFMATVWLTTKKHPDWAPAAAGLSGPGRLKSLSGLLEAGAIFALVVGGLSAGVFTPSEAGAAGSVLALLTGLIGRNFRLPDFHKALLDTAHISATIFLLLAGAAVYGKFIVITRLPFTLAESISASGLPVPMVLLCIFILFFLGGMMMDALALLLITLPIFTPLVAGLQLDPILFCLLLMVVTTLGAVTPPVGASVFIVSSTARLEHGRVFKAALRFIPAYLAALLIMTLWPGLFLFLPLRLG